MLIIIDLMHQVKNSVLVIGQKYLNIKLYKTEKKIFFKRLKEIGANGQWGIFSMEIPGRVGYQVYYKNLFNYY